MQYGSRRGWLNLAVFWLTLLSGAVASSISSLYTFPETEPLKVIGGYDACGGDGNDHLRELSDGTRITMSCSRLASLAAANTVFQNRLASATEIISRKDNFDEYGSRVGETVVARTTSGVVRLNAYNNNFCSVDAATLRHLQWLERKGS